VEKRLSVLEKLQQYKPRKQHNKNASSGARTPFGNNRMSGSHLPYDMNQLNARLHALTPRPPMSRLGSNMSIPRSAGDHENDGDVEDFDKTLVDKRKGKLKKPRKTNSWFRRGKNHLSKTLLVSRSSLWKRRPTTTKGSEWKSLVVLARPVQLVLVPPLVTLSVEARPVRFILQMAARGGPAIGG
jgi:hypothetical protein